MSKLPSISAHKLVEYCFSDAFQRTKVLEMVASPPNFLLDTHYPDIERATVPYLLSGFADPSRLLSLDRALQLRDAQTNHEESRLLNALDAIQHAQNIDWNFPRGASVAEIPKEVGNLQLGPLIVTVRPTVMLFKGKLGTKDARIGLIKGHFRKGYPISDKFSDRGLLYASLLHLHAEQNFSAFGAPETSLCFVADIFQEKLVSCGKSNKSRRKLLLHAADEIVDRFYLIKNKLAHKRSKSAMP